MPPAYSILKKFRYMQTAGNHITQVLNQAICLGRHIHVEPMSDIPNIPPMGWCCSFDLFPSLELSELRQHFFSHALKNDYTPTEEILISTGGKNRLVWAFFRNQGGCAVEINAMLISIYGDNFLGIRSKSC